jgi:hypothetical protein
MYQFIPALTSTRIRKSSMVFVTVFAGMWFAVWAALVLILVVFPIEPDIKLFVSIFLLLDIAFMPFMIWILSKQKPTAYELDGKTLRIKRAKPYKDLEWDLSRVTKMEAKKNYPLFRVIRRARSNNQGVFTISGTVWNAELGGWLRLALTSEENYIQLSGDKFGYAISPADMDGFMRAAQQELHIVF